MNWASYSRRQDKTWESDRFGFMRRAQTANSQAFKTGDGWLARNPGSCAGLDAGVKTNNHERVRHER